MINTITSTIKRLEVSNTDFFIIGDHTPKSLLKNTGSDLYMKNNVQVITFKEKN